MLIELRVRDLGVIEDLTLGLGPGLTALTGETGAGKTLLVEALHLVLGGRGSAAMVRAGASEAMVEARFVRGGGEELVLCRSVPASGRSRAWIDGRMAPVSALADAGREVVDIHGQHEHQSLLSPAAQRRALDDFARTDLRPRHRARSEVEGIDQRLDELGGDERQRARQADILRHQVAEIDAAGVDDLDEEVSLAAEEERLADLAAHREAAALAVSELDGGDLSTLALLGRAASALAGRAAFDGWAGRLRAALTEIGDVASDLRSVADRWQDDPERLAEVQSRRRLLASLRHKYGSDLAGVLQFAGTARRELEALEAAGEEAGRLQRTRAQALDRLLRAEAEVGRVRRTAAPLLAAAVRERLSALAMAGARLEIVVPDGAGDAVQFLLGANPGEPLLPLSRVASGGELARAMLALRLVAMGGPATMVFDEVDAGVGGSAALALAGALAEAAAGRQVLAVTHLPQVAAFADRQILVEKEVWGGRTQTRASELEGPQRVVELSRMLSGHPESTTARAHAEELLSRVGSTAGRRGSE